LAEVKNTLALEITHWHSEPFENTCFHFSSVASVAQTKNNLTGQGQDYRVDGPEK
jgi:hypothetical protein